MHCFECHKFIHHPPPRQSDDGKPTIQYLRCTGCKALYKITTQRVPSNSEPKAESDGTTH